MAKTKISEYDSTAANNTDIDSINIAEGMAPSNVNNAIRELMAHLKDMNIGSTITMLNTTEEDSDGGRVNKIIFKGEQSGGEESVLGEIQFSHDGSADDQKGDLIFRTNDGSDGASPSERLRIDSAGFVGINESAPSGILHVKGTSASHGKVIVEAGGSGGSANNNFVEFNKHDGTKLAEIEVGETVTDGGDIVLKTTPASGSVTERMRVDNSGNVGIGTSSPSTYNGQLVNYKDTGSGTFLGHANGSGTFPKVSAIGLGSDAVSFTHTSGGSTYALSGSAQIAAIQSAASGAPTDLAFYTNASGTVTERVRIDSSGNVLVGKDNTTLSNAGIATFGAGLIEVTRSGSKTMTLNRLSSDGEIINIRKDGSTVGSLGANSSSLYIGDGDCTVFFADSPNVIGPSGTIGAVRDNAISFGNGGNRWSQLFAGTSTIGTSDENEKQQIVSLTDAEIAAAKAISKLFKTFKWNDAVTEKGDNARIHTGVVAQQIKTAMTDNGLDATKYAFYCSDTWWEADYEVAEEPEELDEEGNVVREARASFTATRHYYSEEDAPEGATQKTRLGVRYEQLLAFIGAATEQRLTSIESRLTALEG